MIHEIHVGMRRARVVLEAILDELKRRNADCVERQMISAPYNPACVHRAYGAPSSNCGYPQIVQRLQPLREKRLSSQVVLSPYTSDPSCAIVRVKVNN